MERLYFLGGENVAKRDARKVNASAFADAGGAPRVLVFPWARPSFDTKYMRRKRVTDYFRSMGAQEVEFCEFSEPLQAISSKIVKSNLVYLTGGQVSALISRLKKTGVDKLLHEFSGVIVGRSAGAVALGKRCFVRNRYSQRIRAVAGLEIVNFSVKAHYEPTQDVWLKKMSQIQRIHAIPAGCAVIYDNDSISFIGKTVMFEYGKKHVLG